MKEVLLIGFKMQSALILLLIEPYLDRSSWSLETEVSAWQDNVKVKAHYLEEVKPFAAGERDPLMLAPLEQRLEDGEEARALVELLIYPKGSCNRLMASDATIRRTQRTAFPIDLLHQTESKWN